VIIAQIDSAIARLQQAKGILSGTTAAKSKLGPSKPRVTTTRVAAKERVVSAESRARIAAAQKARWSKEKKAAKPRKRPDGAT
jgi:hypothetical protein